MFLGNTSLMEERDKSLVRRLDQHELQRIAVESDTLERSEDGVQESTTGNYNQHETRQYPFKGRKRATNCFQPQ
jgi:hypothetical protein